MLKQIFNVVGVVAVAVSLFVGCDGDNGANVDPDKPGTKETFIDSRDGRSYTKVTINTQVWMAENLNYDVPNTTTDVCYDNSAENCVKYGRLYDWETALTACPAGWHLSTGAEWTMLTDFIGDKAGTKLKSTSGWKEGNGTDNYGFAALPAGYGTGDGQFGFAGNNSRLWSATSDGRTQYRYITSSDNVQIVNSVAKILQLSVRCVED